MNTHDRIERVPLTVSEKFLTVLSLLWVSLRYHFIGRNIENTHEKRTVRYKSQLICIYICHQFFFIHTSRITLSSVRAWRWNVFWNTCVLVLGPHLAFIFKTNTPSKTPATRLLAVKGKLRRKFWGPLKFTYSIKPSNLRWAFVTFMIYSYKAPIAFYQSQIKWFYAKSTNRIPNTSLQETFQNSTR